MHTQEWHEARRHHVGASEVGAIMGHSPWATALDIWAIKTGRQAPDGDTIATEIGNELEALVLRRAADHLDLPVTRASGSTADPECPDLVVTCDGFVREHDYLLPIDAKTTTIREYLDAPPLHYVLQVQAQMAATGAPEGFLAILELSRRELAVHRIQRHDGVIAAIRKACTAFMAHVRSDTPPPCDDAEAVVLAVHPRDDGTTIALPDEALEHVAALTEIDERTEYLETERRTHRGALVEMLGEHRDGLLVDGRRVRFATQSRTTITPVISPAERERIKAHPGEHEWSGRLLVTQTESRVFRIIAAKKGNAQ